MWGELAVGFEGVVAARRDRLARGGSLSVDASPIAGAVVPEALGDQGQREAPRAQRRQVGPADGRADARTESRLPGASDVPEEPGRWLRAGDPRVDAEHRHAQERPERGDQPGGAVAQPRERRARRARRLPERARAEKRGARNRVKKTSRATKRSSRSRRSAGAEPTCGAAACPVRPTRRCWSASPSPSFRSWRLPSRTSSPLVSR